MAFKSGQCSTVFLRLYKMHWEASPQFETESLKSAIVVKSKFPIISTLNTNIKFLRMVTWVKMNVSY